MSNNKKSVTINKIIRVRMAMVYLIWRAMFGNGVRIGMTVIMIAVFCGAVLGTALQTTCVLLSASSTILRLPTTASVFVVCQDSLLRSSRPLSVHSMIFTVFPMVIYSVFKF